MSNELSRSRDPNNPIESKSKKLLNQILNQLNVE